MQPVEETKSAGFQRRWVTVTDKVDKKAMENVDVSLVKSDGKVDLEKEMEKYLGGDDEVLAGFLNSDDEVETINVAAGQQAASTGLFGRFTSAFKQITGNKVLTHDDMGPILTDFAKALMEKNVAQDVANDICRQVEASLLDQRTASFTSVNTTIKNTLARSI